MLRILSTRPFFLRTEAAISKDAVGGGALTTDAPSIGIHEGAIASVPQRVMRNEQDHVSVPSQYFPVVY